LFAKWVLKAIYLIVIKLKVDADVICNQKSTKFLDE